MAKTADGTTIAATGTAPFAGRVSRIGGWQRNVQVIDDTALDTDDYAEKIFGQIIEHGAIRVEALVDDATMKLPTLGSPQNWSIVTPGNRVLAGSGAIAASVSSEFMPNGRLRETFDLQFDGKTGPTLT